MFESAAQRRKPDCQNDALSAVITVNRPNVIRQEQVREESDKNVTLNRKPNENARNYAETVKYREQDQSIDLTDKVRLICSNDNTFITIYYRYRAKKSITEEISLGGFKSLFQMFANGILN